MADANSQGLSIPGSLRKKKAFSVSLRENNFDISEVPCMQDEHSSLESDRSPTPVADKCYTCGQNLPSKASRESYPAQSSNLGAANNSKPDTQPCVLTDLSTSVTPR